MSESAPHREELREAIIAASLQIGSELGEEGLTMRGLAARLGVSPTALYQHFEGKAAILQEIRLRGLVELLQNSIAVLHQGDLRTVLGETSRRYIAFARANPWLYKLLFESSTPAVDELAEDQRAEYTRNAELLAAGHVEVFEKLARQGDDALPRFMASFWCQLHGLASLVLGGRLRPDDPLVPVRDADGFVADHIELIVDGLMSRIPS